jgi:hypothetical protein
MGGSIYMTLKRCELYEEINDVLHDFGTKKGMAKEDVIEFSDAVIKLLSEVFGGRNFTFLKMCNLILKLVMLPFIKNSLAQKMLLLFLKNMAYRKSYKEDVLIKASYTSKTRP